MNKVSIVCVIGLLLSVLTAVQAGLADTAADLKQAEGLVKAGQYAQAEPIYRKVLQSDPNNAEAVHQSEKTLARIFVATDRLPQAQEAIEQLLTRSAGHARLPHALHEILDQAKTSGKTLQVGQIYQSILEAQRDQPQAVWLKMGIAIANAHLGRDQAVESALADIIDHHKADDRSTEAFGQVAWAYRKLNQQDKARRVYQYVVDTWPKQGRAALSQRGIVLCSLAMNDPNGADKATEELLRQFEKDKNLSEAVWGIARVHRDNSDWKRSRPLCEYILAHDPNSEQAVWAQEALVWEAVAKNDPNGTEAGIRELLTRFSSRPNLPMALYGVANLLSPRNPSKAQELYQYIIDKHPANEFVPLSLAGIGIVKLVAGDEKAAQGLYEKLRRDCSRFPRFSEAVALIGQGYYQRARTERALGRAEYAESYRKAIAVWEGITREMPESAITPQACYHAAVVYGQELGQYDKALDYYQRVAESWPDFEFAWHAQFFIGDCYQKLKKAGAIPADQADAQMVEAYRAVIEKYPDCRSAPNAALRLGQLFYARAQWMEAAKSLEWFLQNERKSVRPVAVHEFHSA